jgi:hypothetical protein
MPKVIKQLNRLSIFASHHIAPRASFLPFALRPSTFGLLLTFNLSFVIINCGLDIENPTPPSAPVWVQKSLPEEWPERGIDAHESGGIILEWEPNQQDGNISTYYIYRAMVENISDSSASFILRSKLKVEPNASSKFLDGEVGIGIFYHYKLKAEDEAHNMSDYSEIKSYSLLPMINSQLMIPNGLSDTAWTNSALSWHYPYVVEMEDYSITILDAQDELIIRTTFSPENYVSEREYWQFPSDLSLDSGHVYRWRIDTNASYSGARESSGSESNWATFRF